MKKSKNDPNAPNLTRIPLPELYVVTIADMKCVNITQGGWLS